MKPSLDFKAPGAREAFFLAWVSLVVTVIAFIAGFAIALVTSSSATLGFALENAVDFLSSALVCWRFWGGGDTVPEHTLAQREKRASVGIAIAFVLLSVVVGSVAISHMAAEEPPTHVAALLALAVPSALAFGALGGLKFWTGVVTDSTSMKKDGLCSLCGALLAGGVIVGVIAAEGSHGNVWWLDAVIAVVVSVGLGGYGVWTLVKNKQEGNQWWTTAFWRTPSSRGPREVTMPHLQVQLREGEDPQRVVVARDADAAQAI